MKTDYLKPVKFVVYGREFDGFQMADGTYKMSVTQTCESCNLDPRRFPQLCETKRVKALVEANLVTRTFFENHKIETVDGIRRAKLIDLRLVGLIWVLSNTQEGENLTDALLIESLERRLDSVFNVNRTEKERELAGIKRAPKCTIARRKEVFNRLCIHYDAASKKHNENHLEETPRNIGKEMTIKINQTIFGVDHFQCQRKNMTTEQQYAIAYLEDRIQFINFDEYRAGIESAVNKATLEFISVFGDFYHLKNIKLHSDEQMTW